MTFLALDTSGTFCVLALAEDDGSVRAVSLFQSKRSLSRRLLGEIDGLLSRNTLTLAEMTAFAVGLGPGSFTGVRVGVTTAKTLAQVLEKPLVGVGTLDAYASALDTLNGAVLPVLPSRRGEVYAAVYERGVCTEAPFAASLQEIGVRQDVTLCGDTALISGWSSPAVSQPWTPPEGLCRIAARRLASADTNNPFSLVPLYVVAPTITMPKTGSG